MACGVVFVVAVIGAMALRATSQGLRLADVATLLPVSATVLVGLLIAVRRPENRTGWIVCGLGLVLALQALLAAVTVAATAADGWFKTALWLDGKSFLFLWGGIIAVLLHFPTGTLPSPRWRIVRSGTIAGIGWGVLFGAIKPGPLAESVRAGVANPANPTAMPELYDRIGFLEPWGLLVLVAALVAGLASLLIRYRASSGTQRLQIRWVVAASVAFVATMLINVGVRHVWPTWLDVADTLAGIAFALIPLSVGIAILRHRLFDIDRIINRTVVYFVLTAVLGAAYLGLVNGMRIATAGFTGDTAIAVAASTLAVAALFQPARRRIQDAVDRRFNRARYDAATTVRQFSTRLREEIDIDSLRAELIGVIGATMQPNRTVLWLQEER